MTQPITRRELSARWLLFIAEALLIFSLAMFLWTDGPFLRWELASLLLLAWISGTVSFCLKRTVHAAVIMCIGVVILARRVL